MNGTKINFTWKGATETERGLAIFAVEKSTYELWLPCLAKALQLNQVLNDVYAQGRRKGHDEMMQATRDAMNETARRQL